MSEDRNQRQPRSETCRQCALYWRLQLGTFTAEAGPEPSLSERTAALVVRGQQQQVGSLRRQQVQSRTNDLPQNQVTGEKLDLTLNQTRIKLLYLGVKLKHQLVSSQEVRFGEQLHVLTDVLHKLNRVRLTESLH